MNLFDAQLTKEGGKYIVSVGGMKVAPSEEKQKNLAAHNVQPQDITLGVRPSHLVLKQGANTVAAAVDVSEMMGSEVYLHANAMGRDVVIIVPTMDLQGNHKDTFAPGASIQFTFGGSVCHMFDHEGRNLEL